MKDWKLLNLMTHISLGGKSLRDIGFPETWKYDYLLMIWKKGDYVLTRKEIICGEYFRRGIA